MPRRRVGPFVRLFLKVLRVRGRDLVDLERVEAELEQSREIRRQAERVIETVEQRPVREPEPEAAPNGA